MADNTLWAIWPKFYFKLLERYCKPDARDAPRCQRCNRVHYLSWAFKTKDQAMAPGHLKRFLFHKREHECLNCGRSYDEMPGSCERCNQTKFKTFNVWYACRAVVADTRDKMEEMAKMVLDEWDLVCDVVPFDNQGVICPQMSIIPLREYYSEMGLMDRGKKVFQVPG